MGAPPLESLEGTPEKRKGIQQGISNDHRRRESDNNRRNAFKKLELT
jgi:hypothetical protein